MQFNKSLIKKLLASFPGCTPVPTHSLSHVDAYFTGNDNRTFLLHYLNYMASKEYVNKHRLEGNQLRWSLTIQGLEMLELLNSDQFIK